ncbi:50S ribosomal protein L13 [Bifidobacterium cuniculi]|uniref:Large ribosomal subunit protein uL13 n=1 Tax=Bifidobacterium cuniculi TaxID=1688 RepID=A0A087AE95_9BIFI|nr:50S ribosomal protein L13 [Bifidobacterium cuniculi]
MRPERGSTLTTSSGQRSGTQYEKRYIVKTFTPKPADLTHDWYIVDATDVVLGRLAAQVANLLRGKNKPSFAPHADSGNYVIVINADKIALTGDKMDKELYSHSGRPGGLRRDSYAELLKNKPERIIMHAVKGMLPKNKLAKVQLTRLRVFAGEEHPHVGQQPQAYEIHQVSQQAK